MYKFITSVIFTCFFALPIQAVEMRVLAWDQNIAGRDLSIAYGSKAEQITGMHHFARSAPIKVKADSESLRLQVNDRLSEKGKPLAVPIALGSSIKQPLLLLIPDKDDPSGIRTLVVEDNVEGFAWGSLRFINLTNEELVFRCDKKQKLIPAGWKPSSVQLGGAARNVGVALLLKKDLKGSKLYSAVWKHQMNERKLIFIIPSKDRSRGPVELKFIVEKQV
ncbi:hypothetical protein ACFPK9_12430 [Rubritalea spongiae]|uniref:Uncharacterized protein n=1 Tax=Rubritalea spongiae TaxID=430797 RepID=A0ABW5E2F0_9BACT